MMKEIMYCDVCGKETRHLEKLSGFYPNFAPETCPECKAAIRSALEERAKAGSALSSHLERHVS